MLFGSRKTLLAAIKRELNRLARKSGAPRELVAIPQDMAIEADGITPLDKASVAEVSAEALLSILGAPEALERAHFFLAMAAILGALSGKVRTPNPAELEELDRLLFSGPAPDRLVIANWFRALL